jgi:hypothetical protein
VSGLEPACPAGTDQSWAAQQRVTAPQEGRTVNQGAYLLGLVRPLLGHEELDQVGRCEVGRLVLGCGLWLGWRHLDHLAGDDGDVLQGGGFGQPTRADLVQERAVEKDGVGAEEQE